MADKELKSISFSLKDNDEPFQIDFFDLDLSVLCQITRILGIENYKKPLIIKVDNELYREVQSLLVNDSWLINLADHIDSEGYNIILNGFELIFKRENNDTSGYYSNGSYP